ncbi:hypothetical protein B0H17DRAFT_1151313 [Mycena rosella]|uniref:Uncharacterized protein n=1 Tax=Mycena rosella TaxID=1033263 RepID=A0AAD7FJT1_MYCRO|nr:hypothetical protein B0H17DRAFT_1151313 [Mycena rosella]
MNLQIARSALDDKMAALNKFSTMGPTQKGNTKDARARAQKALVIATDVHKQALELFTTLNQAHHTISPVELEEGLKTLDKSTNENKDLDRGEQPLDLEDLLNFETAINVDIPFEIDGETMLANEQGLIAAHIEDFDKDGDVAMLQAGATDPAAHGGGEKAANSLVTVKAEAFDIPMGNLTVDVRTTVDEAIEILDSGDEAGKEEAVKDIGFKTESDLTSMELDNDNFVASLQRPHALEPGPKKGRKKKATKSTPNLASLQAEDAQLEHLIKQLSESITVNKLDGLLLLVVQESIDAAISKRLELSEQMDKEDKKGKGRDKGKRQDDDAQDEGEEAEDGSATPATKGSKASHAIEERWAEMDDVEKQNLEKEARQHIKNFLADQTYIIPPRLRRLMKLVLEFLPECAYTSRALVEHIFTTVNKTNNCVFHTVKNARLLAQDNGGLVTGVPYSRGTIGDNARRNALSCGCYKDEALLDYILYKIASARSWNPRVDQIETLHKNPLEIRHRTFIIQAFLNFTGLALEDLYEIKIKVAGKEPVPRVLFGSQVHIFSLMAKVLGKFNMGVSEDQMVVLRSLAEIPRA